jgi:hypothetical protein
VYFAAQIAAAVLPICIYGSNKRYFLNDTYIDTMTIKAIIFDVDGTLADTENAHRIAFNKAFAENHLSCN